MFVSFSFFRTTTKSLTSSSPLFLVLCLISSSMGLRGNVFQLRQWTCDSKTRRYIRRRWQQPIKAAIDGGGNSWRRSTVFSSASVILGLNFNRSHHCTMMLWCQLCVCRWSTMILWVRIPEITATRAAACWRSTGCATGNKQLDVTLEAAKLWKSGEKWEKQKHGPNIAAANRQHNNWSLQNSRKEPK